jgi:hypothetical protein
MSKSAKKIVSMTLEVAQKRYATYGWKMQILTTA